MRVPLDQFLANSLEDITNGKKPLLGRDLGDEDNLEEKVAGFFANFCCFSTL
jgi:hypothetical protein